MSVEAPTDTALKRSLPVQDPPEEWDSVKVKDLSDKELRNRYGEFRLILLVI